MQLSEAQKRVMKWLGKGWTAEPGNGASLKINGERICNLDTMMALYRMGLAQKDDRGSWTATASGKTFTEQLGL